MQSDLRKQFVIFVVLLGIIILVITLLKFAEQPLKEYVMNIFTSTQ